MGVGQGGLVVLGDRLVEPTVLVLGDVGLLSQPDGLDLVDGVPFPDLLGDSLGLGLLGSFLLGRLGFTLILDFGVILLSLLSSGLSGFLLLIGYLLADFLGKEKLEGVLAAVVRYYGGINLGAGGLVRAYTDTSAQALKNATKVPIVPLKTMTCRFPFHLEGIVRNRISQAGVTVVAVERSLDREMMVQGPEDLVDGLVLALSVTGQGRIVWAEV